MRKRLILPLFAFLPFCVFAQKAVVEEYVVDVTCNSPTRAVQHFREVTTILNEQGASLASFVCSCSKNDKLTNFKGLVTDASGRTIKKLKESDLQKTEYSPYLAIDDYKMYLDYTPPAYPITITYEWTIDSQDNVLSFPTFYPQSDYDVSVHKAAYSLKAPKSMNIRHAMQNMGCQVSVSDISADTQLFTLDVSDLPMLKQEPYARPLYERLPLVWFAPTDFVYYGTQGSLRNWSDYGLWEYSLIKGLDTLPDAVRQELHQLTDTLKTNREKVEALYQRLGRTTRYVAVLLGIGGQKPASAADVSKSGFGDCKGLSNYMRAMLKEVGIPSNYTTISTVNQRLLPDFASVGQMNHVILQVPLPDDTLWLECTNPELPMGYVHQDIAGHDAIEVSERGGRLVRLPVYPDSTNLMHSAIAIDLTPEGAADLTIAQKYCNQQYEDHIPMMKMDEKDRQKLFQKMVHVPQAEFSGIDIREEGAKMLLSAQVKSRNYATQTGQRLFVPVCPIHQGYTVPNASAEREEDIFLSTGYLDEDEITLTIPEGYVVETRPKNVQVDESFASFSFNIKVDGNTIRVHYRLLRRSGSFPKSLYPQLTAFYRTVRNAYSQKIVIKKN